MTKETQILDVGFSDNEYSVTDNYLEKHYSYPEKLTALGVENPINFSKRYPKVNAVVYAGGKFPFADKQFDICWSNAVIEHVGSKEAQVLFIKEMNRVAKQVFFTTPNRYFPVETHTRVPLLHYLPKTWFDIFLKVIGKEWASGSYMYLLADGDLRCLLNDAEIDNYMIHRNWMFGFVLDFVVIIK
ncbi:MAG TPA: class I SAM-dependent methyltransferase [Gallionella sp.]|nr:class I SAM-dependent methyltransferase [Gallionella sp.]